MLKVLVFCIAVAIIIALYSNKIARRNRSSFYFFFISSDSEIIYFDFLWHYFFTLKIKYDMLFERSEHFEKKN